MNRFVASILCFMLPVVCVAEAKKDKPYVIPTPPIFQNPFMGANNFSEIHFNSYQTDTPLRKG